MIEDINQHLISKINFILPNSKKQLIMTYTKKPLVSVITIVKNGEKYLEQTILSVINQSYSNIEYIIIDGGSTDGTINIIKKHEKYINYWESKPDKGIANAFNKGINLAKGELIGILNADDWYEISAIDEIVNIYNQNSAVYCGNINLYNHDTFFKIRRSRIKLLTFGMYIMHPSIFVKKQVYDDIGGFDESFKVAMDFDFMLRVKQSKKYPIKYIDSVITNMRMDGTSSDITKMHNEEILVFKKNLNGILLIIAYLSNLLNRIIVQIHNQKDR